MHKWVRMLWGGDLLCKYSKKRQRIKRLTSSIKGQLMTLTDISYLNEWHSIRFRGSIVFFQYCDIISIKEALWFLFYTRYFFSCIRIMYTRIQKRLSQHYELAILRPFLAIFPPTTLKTFTKLRFWWTFWSAKWV